MDLKRCSPVEAEPNRVQQHEARRESDIRLIYSQRQREQHRRGDEAPSAAAAGEIRRKHGEEKCQRVGRACEHEAECPRLGGKRRDHPRQQHAHQRAFYLKKPHDQTHGHCQQHKAHHAVEPRHGVIREDELHRLKPPASGGHGRSLAEEGFDLVGIDELICKGEHMRRQPERKRREKRQPVARRALPSSLQRALQRGQVTFPPRLSLLSAAKSDRRMNPYAATGIIRII